MGKLSLPPGFRFHPTDEELVSYYLRRKVHGRKFEFDAISEVDLYKHEPWDLPEMSGIQTKDLEWYFFSPRDKKYANGSRTNRATDLGYWKATGKDRSVLSGSRSVGMKKTLVYYKGRAPRGARTNWVMHEYRLEDAVCDKVPGSQNGFVLCRIYRKSGPGPKNGEQYGAPVEDDGWETAEDDDSTPDLLKSGPDIIELKPVITSTPGSHSKQVAPHGSGIMEQRLSPSSNLKLVSVKVEPEDIKMSSSNEKLSAVETLPTTYTEPFVTGNLASSTYVETDMLNSSDLFSLAADERDLLLQIYDEVAGPSGGVYEFESEMGSKCFEPFVDLGWNQIDLQMSREDDFLELNDLHFSSEADDNTTGIEPRQITRREISASDLLVKSRLQCDPETKQKELSAHSSGDDNPLTSSFIFKDDKLQALQPDISGCSFKDLASEGLEVSAEVGLVQAMKMQPSVITCTLNTDCQDVVEGFLDYDVNMDKVGIRDDGSHHIAGEMVETDESNDLKSRYYRKEMLHGNADCGTPESDDPSFRAEGRNFYDTSFSSLHTLDRFGFSGSGQTSYTQNETSVNEDATNTPHSSKVSGNDSSWRILAVNEQVDGRSEKQNAIDESRREAERTKDFKGKSAAKTYGNLLNCLETLPILPASAADLSPNPCLPVNSISIMATSVDVSAVTLTCNCAKKASSCIVCSFPELGSSKTIVRSLTSRPKHSMAGCTADLGILALFGVMMALFWLFIIGGALKIFGGIYRLVIS